MADNLTKQSWKILGIEFAPLRIPLKRRLQTLTVAFFFFFLLLAMFIIIPVFTYMLITNYWYITVLFATWIIYDWKTPYQGGRKWKTFRNSKIWHYFRDYFPIKLVKTVDLSPDQNYVFCVYPHGVASAASFLNFQSNANKFDELFPGIDTYLITLNVNFRIPFTKDIFLAVGGISASEKSILHCLKSKPGNSCVLMPGGAREALCSLPGKCCIFLKHRKGFIRIALKTGSQLVPVFSFGENEIFDQITAQWLSWIQEKLRCFWGIAPCLIKGRGFFQYSFGILPYRKPIVTVVGNPIKVPKIENPSKQLIEEYHEKFIEELKSLFNKYKGMYHPKGEEAELNIE